MSDKPHIKIVAVGDQARDRGWETKQLLSAFVDGVSPDQKYQLLFNNGTKLVTLKNYEGRSIEVYLDVWDTAGHYNFDRLRNPHYLDADIFLFCYSCTDPDSFRNIQTRWLPEVNYLMKETPPVKVLVGLNRNLLDDQKQMDILKTCGKSPVEEYNGWYYAEEQNMLFFQVRSDDPSSVDEVFHLSALKFMETISSQFKAPMNSYEWLHDKLLLQGIRANNVFYIVADSLWIMGDVDIKKIVHVGGKKPGILLHTLNYSSLHRRQELAVELIKYNKHLCMEQLCMEEAEGLCCLHLIAKFGLYNVLEEIEKIFSMRTEKHRVAFSRWLNCKWSTGDEFFLSHKLGTPLDYAVANAKEGSQRYKIIIKLFEMGLEEVNFSTCVLLRGDKFIFKTLVEQCEWAKITAYLTEEEGKKLVEFSNEDTDWIELIVRRIELTEQPDKAAVWITQQRFNINQVIHVASGLTLLIKTAMEGNCKLLESLLRFPDLAFEVTDNLGETAWDKAVERVAEPEHNVMNFFLDNVQLKDTADFERGMATMSTIADVVTDFITIAFMFVPNIVEQMEEDCQLAIEDESEALESFFSSMNWSCYDCVVSIRSVLTVHVLLLLIPPLRMLLCMWADNQKLNYGDTIKKDIAKGSQKFFQFYRYQSLKNNNRKTSTIFAIVNFIFSMLYILTAVIFRDSNVWLYFFVPIVASTWMDYELALRDSYFMQHKYCNRKRKVLGCCKSEDEESLARVETAGGETLDKIVLDIAKTDVEIKEDKGYQIWSPRISTDSERSDVEMTEFNLCQIWSPRISTDSDIELKNDPLEPQQDMRKRVSWPDLLRSCPSKCCKCIDNLRKVLVSYLGDAAEFTFGAPLINYFTFVTVAVLYFRDYISKCIRIDVNFFLHGASGFSDHRIVWCCCCWCAVIDEGASQQTSVSKGLVEEKVYINQAAARRCVSVAFSSVLKVMSCKCCFGEACAPMCSCLDPCEDCFKTKAIKEFKDL